MLEILYYILFVSLFISLVSLSTQGSASAEIVNFHSNYWNSSNWVTVTTGDEFWEWSRNGLVSKLFAENTADVPVLIENDQVSVAYENSDFPFTVSPIIVSGTDMTLVGSVRLRQLRVVDSPCSSSFAYSSVSSICSGAFDGNMNEDRSSYSSSECPSYLETAYIWSASDGVSSLISNRSGILYPSGGFAVDLPPDQAQSREMLSDLESNYWLDSQTAAVIVEINSYHPSLDFLVTDRFLFEFSETGSIFSSLKTVALPLRVAYFSPSNTNSAPLLVLDCLNLILYTFAVAWFGYLVSSLRMRIIRFKWTIFDFSLIVVLGVYFGYRISMYIKTSNVIVGDGVFDQPTVFYPLSAVQGDLEAIRISQTLSIVLLVARSLKLVSLISLKWTRVVSKSFPVYVGVTIVAVLGIVGIGFARHTALSHSNPFYARLPNAILSVALSLVGVVWVQEFNGIGGFLSLVIVAFLYLLISPTLITLNVDGADGLVAFDHSNYAWKNNPLVVFCLTTLSLLRGKDTIEEIDETTQNGVEMNILPGIITKRIIARRKSLLARVEAEYNMIVAEFDEYDEWVNKKELARLMEQDQFICKIMGTNDAEEVIRRFGVNIDQSNQLQLSIDRKLDRLNKMVLDLNIQMHPVIGELSDELDSLITDCRVRIDRDMRPLMETVRILTEAVGSLQGNSPKVRKSQAASTQL